MNITIENIDNLNALLKVEVRKSDYSENVEKVLKEYRRKANVKGFRPGMVPMGIIRKMHGKVVQLDEINKIVSDSISKYLTEEKINILGDPLPVNDDTEFIDFENQEDFDFTFEVGLAPDINLNLTKKNKVDFYEITIDEKMRKDYISNYTKRFGEFRIADTSGDSDMLKGSIFALDESGNINSGDPGADETTLSVSVIKDKKIKKDFTGRKSGESIDFDLRKAFPNDFEIAGILKKQKDDVAELNGKYRFTISEISRFEPAALNKDLFDKLYGENVINTEEEFMEKIDGEISENLRREGEYKLMLDIKKLAMSKTDIELPEEFLRKWLIKVNDQVTSDQIDKDFNSFKEDLKWQLIRNKVARDNELKVTEEEMHEEAEKVTRYQFQQYGLFYATDDQIHNYAHEMLKREDDVKRIAEKILEEKAIEKLKESVKIESKQISMDDFNKLFE